MAVLTKTRNDLILRTLNILGITAENRPAFPNEITMVDDRVDGLIKDLAVRNIAYIGDDEEIDPAQFEPLAFLLANVCAQPFGMAGLEPRDGVPVQLYWETILVEQNYGRPSYAPLAVDYF